MDDFEEKKKQFGKYGDNRGTKLAIQSALLKRFENNKRTLKQVTLEPIFSPIVSFDQQSESRYILTNVSIYTNQCIGIY